MTDTVRDTGAPMTEAGERLYEVVRDGVQVRTILMRDKDAINYAKAMGMAYVLPEPVAQGTEEA